VCVCVCVCVCEFSRVIMVFIDYLYVSPKLIFVEFNFFKKPNTFLKRGSYVCSQQEPFSSQHTESKSAHPSDIRDYRNYTVFGDITPCTVV